MNLKAKNTTKSHMLNFWTQFLPKLLSSQDELSPFQRSLISGYSFEAYVYAQLRCQGWKLHGKAKLGNPPYEIDQILENKNGIKIYCDVKGCSLSNRPGLTPGFASKIILANAILAKHYKLLPYIIITSNLPKPNTIAHKLIEMTRYAASDIIAFFAEDSFNKLHYWLNYFPEQQNLANVVDMARYEKAR